MSDEYFDDLQGQEPATQKEAAPPNAPQPERTIRNINVVNSARMRPRIDEGEPRGVQPPPPPRPHKPSRRRGYLMWVLAALAIVVIGAVGLLMFRPTTVHITPRSQALAFPQNGVALTAQAESAASPAVLPYRIEELSTEVSQTAAASGVQRVEEKAEGDITVYNNHSSATIKLVTNTRFESPQGLVYRTTGAIVIPGKTATGPGKVSVHVVADKAGDQYNIGPIAKFTVPGLKGSKEYDNVYGSSANAFSGGFSGERPTVAPATLSETQASLRANLTQTIGSQIASLSSGERLAFPDLYEIRFESRIVANSETEATITERAVALVPTFDRATFSSAAARLMAADAEGDVVRLMPGSDFSVAVATTSLQNASSGPITLTLFGSATLIWVVDEEGLQEALAGKEKSAFEEIVSNFRAIQEAKARVMPPWKGTFPTDPADVHIRIIESKDGQES